MAYAGMSHRSHRSLGGPPPLAVERAALSRARGAELDDLDEPHDLIAFGPTIALAGHAEVTVHFRCAGAVLAGTLFLPERANPLPAVVYVHSTGQTARWK
jgi:hypothetical protein